ncbi:hypothetical protein V6N11_070161 [Hibiscus sabdariffa]|uniref:Uncharacterized protein n=1 Tax=Hibiscus sabdariffa TaxID=183260 RepID=A0ABR2QEA0_9ROSI
MQTTNKLKAARTPSGSLIGRNEPRIFLELLQYFFKLSPNENFFPKSHPPIAHFYEKNLSFGFHKNPSAHTVATPHSSSLPILLRLPSSLGLWRVNFHSSLGSPSSSNSSS